MSDSDFEVPADVEIDPAFYKRMKKANDGLETAFKTERNFTKQMKTRFLET